VCRIFFPKVRCHAIRLDNSLAAKETSDDRRVIELAKASKSLEEAARIMKRTPERIRQVARRLGVSLKPTGKTDVVAKRNPKQKL
jgi:hypothetical protein